MIKKIINYLKRDIMKTSIIAIISIIFVSSIIYIVGATYASGTYTIIFNRYEDNEVMRTCETDASGKLDEDCITTISDVCSRWSPDSMYSSGGQSNQISSSDFANMTFTKDEEYYCVAGSSGTYNMGCYVCKTDDSIMHWSSSGVGNDSCPAGYNKSSTILTEEACAVSSCYVCSTNNNIMKWDTDGKSDAECTSGYNPIDKPQNQCVTTSCYVCKNDSNIMKWSSNGNSDSECSAGYTAIDKPQNECKTIIPDACYICSSNNNILKWDNNGNADSNCSTGYNATDIPQNECVPIENPKTGNILIFIVWVIGLGSLGYTIYYYKNSRVKN